MNCTECKEHLVAYVEGLLDESQKQTVAEHLKNCPACQAEADELTGLQERLVRNGKAVAQSDLENDVMNHIVREQNVRLKTAAKASGSDSLAQAKQLLEKCEKIGEASIIVGQLSAVSVEQAREAIDMLKKKAKSAAIVLGFDDDGKVTLLAGITNDLIKKGISAGDIVKNIAPIVDGGGGGRPQMAQAGGKNPQKIGEALSKAAQIIKEKLDT